MADSPHLDAWIDSLAAAIRQGHRVPQLDPVPDLDQAYAIHAALPAATGRPVIGWKAGATAEAPQQAFGLSEPFYAPLLDGYLYQDRASLPVATFQKRAVEVEVAVRLAKDMDTVPGDPAIAGDYIDDLMPAIEVLDHRFADWDGLAATSMIADLGGNAALVLGAPVAGWRDVDLAAETTQLLVDGEPVAEGQGAAVMGHPFNSLIWLAGKRLAAGAPLRAGEIVTTGTWLGNKVVPAGKDIAARFERLGEVHLRFE